MLYCQIHVCLRALFSVAIFLMAATVASYSQPQPWLRHTIDSSSTGADGVKLADINGDGLPDIVTGWEEGDRTRLYLHPGVAEVKVPWPAVTVGTTPSVEDAVFADLDGDGKLEILSCTEKGSEKIYVHWSQSDKSARPDPMAAGGTTGFGGSNDDGCTPSPCSSTGSMV